MTLDEAVERADLPGLVARYFPESGASPGKEKTVRAVWRGERKPSFSLFRRGGVWFFRDHATGESGNAWHFLLEIAGLSEEEALRVLGVGEEAERKDWRETLREGQERLRRLGRVPREIQGRGFTFEDTLRLGFGVHAEGVLIPILSPKGEVWAVKVKRGKPPPKYRYLASGMGAKPWHSPGFGERPRPVLVVEGELNAAIAWASHKGMDYVGVAGAEASPLWKALRGRKVFLAADGDEAGERALKRWKEEAWEEAGILAYPLPPLEQDFCEVAGERGKEELSGLLEGMTGGLWYLVAVGTEKDLEALREKLDEVVLEERLPLGLYREEVVWQLQAWGKGRAEALRW